MEKQKITWGGRLLALIIGLIFFLGVSEIALRLIFPSWDEFGTRFVKEIFEPGSFFNY